jgi:hemoglobin
MGATVVGARLHAVAESTVRMEGVPTLYEHAGGMAFFARLVDAFYARVEADPVLLGLYPEPHDLGPARHRLTLFLAQYWGGPTTYSDERGHPRLRMRHAPFAIAERERDHWLAAMRAAVAEVDPAPAVADALVGYFEMAADAMRNA